MYELFTGLKPFQASNILEMLHNHIVKIPLELHLINPYIPKPVSAIIMKLIEKEPELRYQSAEGILYDLEQCLMSFVQVPCEQ